MEMESMKKGGHVFGLVAMLLLGACTTNAVRVEAPDGSARIQVLAGDPLLGNAGSSMIVDAQQIDPHTGNPVPGTWERRIVNSTSPSIATVATGALLGAVLPAAVQGGLGYVIARQRRDCGDNCSGVSVVNVNETRAGANADANSGSVSGAAIVSPRR